MTTDAYDTANLTELTDQNGWAPIRQALGVQSVGVNGWSAREAGGTLISDHDEIPSGHEELYVVTAGHATFTVDGDEIDAPTGTIVFVRDPAVKRTAVARDADTTVLALGGRPGAVYRPRAWELNGRVMAAFEAGDFETVKQLTAGGLDVYEDRGLLLYNMACAEAQLGELDDALEHLRGAVEERPDFREFATGDEDLVPLRDDPRFAAIVGSYACRDQGNSSDSTVPLTESPGTVPPAIAQTLPLCATTPSPWRGVARSGSASQRRVATSYANTVLIVPPTCSPPTETIRPPIVAAPVPPRGPGTGGRALQRRVRGSHAWTVERFVSIPALRPAIA